jgi:AcrR family transcriptional regulator
VVKSARPAGRVPRRPLRPPAAAGAAIADRRQRQQARTREEILLAAARALARGGHKAVSMNDIAAEVGFTAPALYAYFASKESIFAALAQLLGQEIAETFVTPPRGLPFREKLRLLVREALTWADRRRELLLALFALRISGQEPPCPPQAAPGRLTWDLYTPRVSEWLRQAGRRSRELAGHDPQEAACVLVGIMHGFFHRWLADSAGPTTRLAEQSDRIVDFFLYGLSGGAAHA